MRDSYEIYQLYIGEPIAIIASEFTEDLRIISATKNGAAYPPKKAIEEVWLRASSKAYAALLRRDYAGLRGDEGLEPTTYVLITNNMRKLTIVHKSPHIMHSGKFIVMDNMGRCIWRFPCSKITYAMLDRLQPEEES